jgi:hypothetical protein
MFTPPLPLSAPAGGHCSRAAMAAPLVCRSSLPQRLAVRQDTALRGLDRRLRMGEEAASGVSSRQGLRTVRGGREPGVLVNIANLKQYGMPYAGTGEKRALATAPGYLDPPQGRVAFLAACDHLQVPGGQAVDQRLCRAWG